VYGDYPSFLPSFLPSTERRHELGLSSNSAALIETAEIVVIYTNRLALYLDERAVQSAIARSPTLSSVYLVLRVVVAALLLSRFFVVSSSIAKSFLHHLS
jgi:hypothetical protein